MAANDTRSQYLNHIVRDEINEINHVSDKMENKSSEKVKNEKGDVTSTSRAFLVLAVIFIVSFLSLFLVYYNFPKLESEEIQYIKLPCSMDDAKSLGTVLSHYKDRYYFTVLGGYFLTYIFLQSFAIPGSIFLSILSGFLFPFPLAIVLVCLCSALGASFCYLLSYMVGRRIVLKYFPHRVAGWSTQVNKHRSHLLNYIIFLRITPFLPNWLINCASPIIDVPLTPFFVGTFIGVAPPSFLAIHAGTTLHELTSSSDAISWFSIMVLTVLAIVSLLPAVLSKKLRSKLE